VVKCLEKILLKISTVLSIISKPILVLCASQFARVQSLHDLVTLRAYCSVRR
jgi:hypothetical protein